MRRTLGTSASSPYSTVIERFVLTNDPSVTAWGWAVIDPKTNLIHASGAIKTTPSSKKLRIRKGDDRIRRIQIINTDLIQVIKNYNIRLILSEQPHGSQSAVAALMIGIVLAEMQTIGDCLNIPVEWFSESDAKLAATGSRSIEKDDMVKVAKKLFPSMSLTNVKWRDQAVADALAVYYVARQQSTSLKMISR